MLVAKASVFADFGSDMPENELQIASNSLAGVVDLVSVLTVSVSAIVSWKS
jgi:hypothetical protein